MFLSKGVNHIRVKLVFKMELNEKGEIDKYKARLMAKGYVQQHTVDYTKVFDPVARLDIIQLILILAAQNSWNIFRLLDLTSFD